MIDVRTTRATLIATISIVFLPSKIDHLRWLHQSANPWLLSVMERNHYVSPPTKWVVRNLRFFKEKSKS